MAPGYRTLPELGTSLRQIFAALGGWQHQVGQIFAVLGGWQHQVGQIVPL